MTTIAAFTPLLVIGDIVGGVTVELVSSDRRAVRTPEVIEAWRAAVPSGGPSGPPGEGDKIHSG